MAKTAGYKTAKRIKTPEELQLMSEELADIKGPAMYEIMVSLDSRADLCRPAESAMENRDSFMDFIRKH